MGFPAFGSAHYSIKCTFMDGRKWFCPVIALVNVGGRDVAKILEVGNTRE